VTYGGGASSVGDVSRLVAWGTTIGGGGLGNLQVQAFFNPGGIGGLMAQCGDGVLGARYDWCFVLQFTVRSLGAQGKIQCDAYFGVGDSNLRLYNFGRGEITFDSTVDNQLRLVLRPSAGVTATLQECTIERLPPPRRGGLFGRGMAQGTINGATPPAILPTSSSYSGTLSASVAYASTWYAATAFLEVGTNNITQAITFTYQGAEGGGGPAVGLRWSQAGQQGNFAFINTNASPPVIALRELTSGWTSGTSATSSSLTLTPGNT
jgi:hypothetical protein